MNGKMEFSKKIVLTTGVIFAIVVAVCMGIFVCCTVSGVLYDWSGIVTLLSISGGVFGTTTAAYMLKARQENLYKIRKSFLQEKYSILNEMNILTTDRAQQEVETEIDRIDGGLEAAENEDVTYQVIG